MSSTTAAAAAAASASAAKKPSGTVEKTFRNEEEIIRYYGQLRDSVRRGNTVDRAAVIGALMF